MNQGMPGTEIEMEIQDSCFLSSKLLCYYFTPETSLGIIYGCMSHPVQDFQWKYLGYVCMCKKDRKEYLRNPQ